MTPDALLARLRDLPGVTVQLGEGAPAHFSYYILHFTQPLDHNDLSRGTFQQEVSLLHRDERAPSPLIIYTSGYWDDEHSTPVELTALLDANQVSIEHRFYGESRPDTIDWSLLTVDQAAADEHEIIQALHTIYEGAFLSVGESKGGITALLHRSFYPTDVNGTVAYVTPLSFNAPDPRYSQQFDNGQIGDPDCRAAVRSLAMEMLAHRRMQMVERAQTEADHAAATYSRVLIGPAVEAAIAGLEWGFWQTSGDGHCDALPHPTDSDETLFAFLKSTSPVSEYNDEQIGYYEPYYYQSYSQLGFPDYSMSYLSDQMWYGEVDYLGELPTPEPAFDSSAMDRLQTWLQDPETDEHDRVTRKDLGKHILFLYGDWDPWFAGRVVTGEAQDVPPLIQPRGNHFTQLTTMDRAYQTEAFAYIQRWTGVEPLLWRVQHQVPSESTRKLGKQRHPLVLAARARLAPR
ncbi:MAG TPA: S28 family serine protease [Kofleriaceae bacterium]|nr:S28 family serine protease [Kofleriaceae bacterium]